MIRTTKLKELEGELPDHTLLATFVAGLPVYDVELEVRIMARERLSALQEYVLRCVSQGVSYPTAIDLVLGIGEPLIRPTLAYLQSYDLVGEALDGRTFEGAPAFELTERGRSALLDLAVRRAMTLSLPCTADALTDDLHPRKHRMRLATKGSAAAEAIHAIEGKFDRPVVANLDKMDVHRVMKEIRRADPTKLPEGEVLDVLEVTQCVHKYRVVDVAVFDDAKGSVLLRVFDRGERLKQHEQLLNELVASQPEILPLEIAAPHQGPVSGAVLSKTEMEQARDNAEALAELDERIERAEVAGQEPAESPTREGKPPTTREQLAALQQEHEKLLAERETLRAAVDQGFRMIGTEEHRRLLERALRNAKDLVIIESPWLTRDAIDEEFKGWLWDALDRGLDVVLAWGYPDEGKHENREKNDRSRSVAEMLAEQAKRPRTGKKKSRSGGDGVRRGRLRVVEVGDTHSKTLVADLNFAVVSSYNWLSFRGVQRAGQVKLRNERGYRIGLPEKVKEIRDDLLRRVQRTEASLAEHK